jgi:alpha-galactosidase
VHQTALTPNEQYTHISLWCLLCSPLLIGCDMTQLDQFTLNLLTNDEVLEISQDLLGKQAGRVAQAENLQVWAKPMEDGSMAVGLFNLGESEQPVVAKWSDLGLSGEQIVRDLWRQKDLGKFDNSFTEKVARHGTVLVRIRPAGK